MIESSFEFTVSSKNKPILIASGHEFSFKRKNKFTENWICSKYQTHKCRATAITENNELIETRGEHNHDITTTFKITPKMFYQLYSIHVSVSGIAPACIYAFLPNKTEKTYNRFLINVPFEIKFLAVTRWLYFVLSAGIGSN